MLHLHVIGDSHIGCLSTAHRNALKSAEKPNFAAAFHSLGGGAVAYDLLMRDNRDRLVLNPLLRTAVVAANRQAARLSPPDTAHIAVCVGGYISSVYTWDRKLGVYDLVVESVAEGGADPETMLVPASMIRESLAAHFKVMVDALNQVKRQTELPVTVLSAPAPYRSSAEIVERMATKRAVAKDDVPQPLHESVRLKVARIAQDVLHSETSRIGLPFQQAPADAIDADGYLLPRYYGDGFHANAAYGALVLRDLVARASGRVA